MKFSVLQDTLIKPLALVSGAVERRHTLPILSHVLISIENQKCTLIGTDSEVELIYHLTLDQPADNGQFTAPARKLLDICRALPTGENIEFSLENQRLTIKSGRARFNLPTLPAEEFPHIDIAEAEHQITLSANGFLKILQQTHFAMGLEDVRYFLNGALFEVTHNEMKAVATDGHRLAVSQTSPITHEHPLQSIIPRKAVIEMMRLFQNKEDLLHLHFGGHFLKVSTSEYTLITKLIDARYPDYRKVIPRPSDKYLLLEKEQLQQALNCIAIISTEKHRGVRMKIRPNLMQLTAKNPEQEETEHEITIFEQTGDELDIGFNVSYLLDALNAIESEQVKITFADSASGIILENTTGEGGRFVVMPMRL